MYKAQILAHSKSKLDNSELVTFMVTYPRIIHSEMCRHREFSRNTASSRAIPFTKMLEDIKNDPFIPIAWQKKHSGMQGSEYFKSYCNIDFKEVDRCFQYSEYKSLLSSAYLRDKWLDARDSACAAALELHELGVTKQITNRLVESFMWSTEIITTSISGLKNFFDLRCPAYTLYEKNDSGDTTKTHVFKSKKKVLGTDFWYCVDFSELDWLEINQSYAEIHIQKIAEMMYDTFNASTPSVLHTGEYHIPDFGIDAELLNEYLKASTNPIHTRLKIAVAQCARLSFTTLGEDKKIDFDKDLELYEKLKSSRHMSPFEHVARVPTAVEYLKNSRDGIKGYFSNFLGFVSVRYDIEKNKTTF